MRRLAAFLLTLALLLTATAASADGTYQTANGQQTIASMADALRGAGYGGPFDTDSIVAAYADTTGGDVVLVDTSPNPPPTPRPAPATVSAPPTAVSAPLAQRPAVMLIGGANSFTGSPTFFELRGALRSRGYSDSDIIDYGYRGLGQIYNGVDTCQDLGVSEQLLFEELQVTRANRGSGFSISLVGHSLGGLIALETLMRYPQLQPLVRSITTIDSPLGGLSSLKEGIWLDWYGLSRCVSMDELVPMAQSKVATFARLRVGAQQLISKGTWVTTIINDSDNLFVGATADQGIPGVAVNVEADWSTGGFNHDAVLTTSNGLATVLQHIP